MNERRIDEKLIFEMGQGSTDALAALYEETKSAVYAFAFSILSDRHEAEDVMQETYLRAYAAAARYVPQGKPMAWLLTVTKNLSLMRLREGKRTAEEAEDLASPAFEALTLDKLSLNVALAALSETEREIVVLHAVAGLKHRETAALLDLALPTVLSKYQRALSKLRKLLKEEG